jgi:hypothetical protein
VKRTCYEAPHYVAAMASLNTCRPTNRNTCKICIHFCRYLFTQMEIKTKSALESSPYPNCLHIYLEINQAIKTMPALFLFLSCCNSEAFSAWLGAFFSFYEDKCWNSSYLKLIKSLSSVSRLCSHKLVKIVITVRRNT